MEQEFTQPWLTALKKGYCILEQGWRFKSVCNLKPDNLVGLYRVAYSLSPLNTKSSKQALNPESFFPPSDGQDQHQWLSIP